MVRFQQKKAPYNPLGRREQRRLLGLVLALGLVFFLMHQASQPESWHWFMLLSQDGGQAAEIDTRLLAKVEGDLPGTFTSPAVEPKPRPAGRAVFPGVDPELLADVRDDTVFRSAEHDAFFHLLKILDETDEGTLAGASIGPTAFVQLYQQPDEYRGQLVSTQGKVHRVVEKPAAKNRYGIEKYYQVWLQPNDAPGNPLVLYVLNLPEGFPIGTRVLEPVVCHGFFFKRWAYPGQDAIRSTPMLLTRTLRWNRPVATPPPAPVSRLTIAGIISGGLLIAGVTVWLAMKGSRSPIPYARRSALPSVFVPPDHDSNEQTT